MEFRELHHFLIVAQHGSLRAAAEAAAISQPGLTKSIHSLENKLGVRLFDRHPRGIRLTVFGEALMLHARSVQAELRLTSETMRELRATTSGLVRLGAGPSMSAVLLPSLTSRLMQGAPSIRLQIRSGLNDSLLLALQRGELDYTITSMPVRPVAGLLHQPLFNDNVVIVACRGHKWAQSSATMTDLAASRWIMPNRNVLTHIRLAELFGRHGLVGPDIWVETDSIPYLLDVVAQTDLLSYVPDQLISSHDLAVVDVPGTTWRRTVGLSSWQRRTQTPASRLFLSVLQDVVREIKTS